MIMNALRFVKNVIHPKGEIYFVSKKAELCEGNCFFAKAEDAAFLLYFSLTSIEKDGKS